MCLAGIVEEVGKRVCWVAPHHELVGLGCEYEMVGALAGQRLRVKGVVLGYSRACLCPVHATLNVYLHEQHGCK